MVSFHVVTNLLLSRTFDLHAFFSLYFSCSSVCVVECGRKASGSQNHTLYLVFNITVRQISDHVDGF